MLVSWGIVSVERRSFAQEPPVPGFGVENELPPVPGFGTTGELFSVRITDQDRRTVDERFRRYDKNQDGYLSRDELSGGRGSDDPFIFDRNGDGRLSKYEMGTRYARRRMDAETDRLMKFYMDLDKNGNKMLEPEEYADNRSRSTIEKRIREAGMDPSRPISLSAFMSRRLGNAGIKPDQVKKAVKSLGSQQTGQQLAEAKRLMSFYVGLDKNQNNMLEPAEYANNPSRSTIEKRIREAGMNPSRAVSLRSFLSKRMGNAGIKSDQIRKTVRSLGSARVTGTRTIASEDSRRSYRFKTAYERLPEDLPDWFLNMDVDRDGQVEMAEYSSTWTTALVAEFLRHDLNRDGLITARESMAGLTDDNAGN
jgi:hypothetical protein